MLLNCRRDGNIVNATFTLPIQLHAFLHFISLNECTNGAYGDQLTIKNDMNHVDNEIAITAFRRYIEAETT